MCAVYMLSALTLLAVMNAPVELDIKEMELIAVSKLL